MPASKPLSGKIALVTGSTTGLGLAIAQELGRQGARVALNYARNQTRASTAFQEFKDGGGEGILVAADVCDPEGVRSLVSLSLIHI